MIYTLLSLFTASTRAVTTTTSWTCDPRPPSPLALPAGLSFHQLMCSSPYIPVFGRAGPLNVSVLAVDLALGTLRLTPITNTTLSAVGVMGASGAARGRKLWGGINGGYFWRTDVSSFADGVCLGKTRADATAAPSASAPNHGVGDGAVVGGGALLGSNCNCVGFSRPAVLTLNGSSSRVDVVHRGDPPPFGLAFESIAAGPNLVSSNASGAFVDIPKDDDNIGNILEHSANTAVGLLPSGIALLVTTDGFDECSGLDPTCGANAFTLAYLMKDFFNVSSALGMDQGGSTTMWVQGLGVVSNPGKGERDVFSALFVEEL